MKKYQKTKPTKTPPKKGVPTILQPGIVMKKQTQTQTQTQLPMGLYDRVNKRGLCLEYH